MAEATKIVIEFRLGEDEFIAMGVWEHLMPTFQLVRGLGYQLTHAVWPAFFKFRYPDHIGETQHLTEAEIAKRYGERFPDPEGLREIELPSAAERERFEEEIAEAEKQYEKRAKKVEKNPT